MAVSNKLIQIPSVCSNTVEFSAEDIVLSISYTVELHNLNVLLVFSELTFLEEELEVGGGR